MFCFDRDFLAMSSHCKGNRTYLTNKGRHCNVVTGNTEVLLKAVRVCCSIICSLIKVMIMLDKVMSISREGILVLKIP